MIYCGLASKMNHCFLYYFILLWFLVLLSQTGITVVIITLFVPGNGKTNEPWKFLLHCFSSVANICSFPSQGMCLFPSPIRGHRWSRYQCEEWCWAGVHPAGATGPEGGNSTTMTVSGIGSWLSKMECPKDEGTGRNMAWVTGGGARSDHQAAREVQNSNRYRVQWFFLSWILRFWSCLWWDWAIESIN